MPTNIANVTHTLIINVTLTPGEVQQQWAEGSLDSVKSVTTGIRLRAAGLCISLTGSTHSRERVQYHLPQAALNMYTDSHGLQRVGIELGSKTFACPVFTRLTQLILPSLEAPTLNSSMFLQHFALMFCAHVVHIHSNGIPEPARSRGGLSAWQKRVTTSILAKNRYENTKLSTLADECHLSVSHFARSFKTSFGQPVHRWLINQRVERSKELLLRSNSPLLEVAFEAGFTDQATFNRTFAKIVGTSPGRWRKAYKQN